MDKIKLPAEEILFLSGENDVKTTEENIVRLLSEKKVTPNRVAKTFSQTTSASFQMILLRSVFRKRATLNVGPSYLKKLNSHCKSKDVLEYLLKITIGAENLSLSALELVEAFDDNTDPVIREYIIQLLKDRMDSVRNLAASHT